MKSKEGLVSLANIVAKENGIEAGSKVLVTGGTPGVVGQTNYLELITIK
jgi:pyruvate kinase